MLERLSARVIVAIVAGLFVLAVIFGGPAACSKIRSLEAQSKVDRSQGEAQRNSAGDAVNTVTGVGANAAASEEMTRQNEKEIRNAPGANDPVNPATRDAGLRSLCRRSAYRDNPKCRMLQPPAG